MDPLSVTASAVALATAALQSAKALHDLVDGLADAPHSVSHSKSLLSQTQTTLGTLARTLETNCAPDTVDSVLKEIELNKVLESTKVYLSRIHSCHDKSYQPFNGFAFQQTRQTRRILSRLKDK